MTTYPISLNVTGKPVVVVGAGRVGTRRARPWSAQVRGSPSSP